MRCCLHSSFAEATAQQRAQVVKHRLATNDEDPWIHDGVEGIEAEGCEVSCIATKWVNGIYEACDLKETREGQG